MQIINKVWRYRRFIKYYIFYHVYVRRKCKVNMYSIKETLDTIHQGVSVCRFGEGEFKWMLNLEQDSFQEGSQEMASDLSSVLKSEEEEILLCIPDVFNNQGSDVKELVHSAKRYWERELGENGVLFWRLLDKNTCYYNLNITRFYMDYKDKENAVSYFNQWKAIWKAKEVVIVEGEFTRFGIGNDLLYSVKKTERIICPAANAYACKHEIMEYIGKNVGKDKLILLALGPTATILAYELHRKGYWAIDIGHLDIEYEWYNRNACEKTLIEGKYVNEAGGICHENLTERDDLIYKNQIIYDLMKGRKGKENEAAIQNPKQH